jgi:lipoprotein-releasing system permease protein
MIPIAVQIGLRYAKIKSKNRFAAFINLFSVLGLTLGVLSLIVVIAVMSGLEGQLKGRMLNIIPHVIIADSTPLNVTGEPSLTNVRTQAAYYETQALLQSNDGLAGVVVQGLDESVLSEQLQLEQYLLSGELSQLSTQRFNIIIGQALARRLQVEVGQEIRILLPSRTRFTPLGRIPTQRLVKVVGIYQMLTNADDYMVFMPAPTVAKLMPKERQNTGSQRLFLADAFDLESIEQYLVTQRVAYTTWRDREGAFFDAVRMEKNMMALMLSLVIAVAAFNIIASLVMLVNEKRPDIAILRTQGCTSNDILLIFIVTGLANAVKGTLTGCVLGVALVLGMNPLLMLLELPIALAINGDPVPYVLNWQDVLMVASGALLLCFIATLPPSMQALKMSPAKALQAE